MTCIHTIVGVFKKKKEKKGNCPNISQLLCSFKTPTTETNSHVLTHKNDDLHMLMQKSVRSYIPPVLILLKLQTMVCPWLTMYKVALRCTLFVCFFHLSAYSLHLCLSGFYQPHHCSPYATISTLITCYWVSSHSHTGNHIILITLPVLPSPE